jgi:hypothetical protein
MNKRSVGNKLEDFIVDRIREIEPRCRRTKNSGASTELEDILSSFFMVQCKVDNTHENIIIKQADWRKLFNALPINSKRIPLFVNQNKSGTVSITLSDADFFRLVYRCFNATGELS